MKIADILRDVVKILGSVELTQQEKAVVAEYIETITSIIED